MGSHQGKSLEMESADDTIYIDNEGTLHFKKEE
jgi:hypothetical protein